MRAFVVAFLFALLWVTHLGASHADGSQSEALQNRITSGLEPALYIVGEPRRSTTLVSRMKYYRVPAVSIAVIDDYRVAWAYASGLSDVRQKNPATTRTLFQAASMSKPVAAAAILRLFEEKRLNLDADVNTMLRSWHVPPSRFTATEHVTMRRLLSHSAGVNVHGFIGYDRDAALPTPVQVLNGTPPANSGAVRVVAIPGSVTEYSGGGTTIAQQLAADVTGQPFATFMQRTLLDPLHMTSSTFEQPLPKSWWPLAAAGYDADSRPVHGGWYVYPTMAAAGLWTTPSDLAQFVIAIQKALRGNGIPPIDAAVAHEMTTEASQGFGLGPQLLPGYFTHNGGNVGFRGIFIGLTRGGKGVVVMTNSDNGLQLADEIVHSIAKAYRWPVLQPQPRRAIPLSRPRMRQLVGTYTANVGGESVTLDVTIDGRAATPALFLRSPNSNFPERLYALAPLQLVTLSGTTFEISPTANDERVPWLKFGQTRFDRQP
ncbi:MAG: beta-lactamase family protein [Candidatus Eremiobacteraeota bacterium]|nr:beta-lactamase family protein [Candidatus Eremiobacteraeota bacterium]